MYQTRATEPGFDNPLPSKQIYAKDALILAPVLRQPITSTSHPRGQIQGLRFPDETTWDEFLHRYYKPVADACIRFGGVCLKQVIIFVGDTVTLSGSGSSDSDGPAADDIPQHWYWDLNPTVDTGGAKPVYPITSTVVLDDPCTEDCDRNDVDGTDDDPNADAKLVEWICPEPGEYSFRLMTHDEHNDQKNTHDEETHHVHWKLDAESVSLTCIDPKLVIPPVGIPGELLHYVITLPANPTLDGPTTGSIQDPLPDLVQFEGNLTCSSGACNYSAETNTVTWSGELTPDSVVTMEFDVRVPEDGPPDWPDIVNEVELFDGVTTRQFVETTPVQCVPTKRSSEQIVTPGQPFTYTITVPANPELTEISEAFVEDPLPQEVQFTGN